MSAPQWNVPKLYNTELRGSDIERAALGVIIANTKFLSDSIEDDERCASAQMVLGMQVLAEYLFFQFGQPACYIPAHLAELFMRSKYEVKSESLRLPIDSFQLILPAGYQLDDGTYLQALHILRVKSKLCHSFVARLRAALPDVLLAVEAARQDAERLAILPYLPDLAANLDDFVEYAAGRTYIFPWIDNKQIGGMPLNADLTNLPKPLGIKGTSGRHLTEVSAHAAQQLTVAALCRYTARPETVKDYTLPRSERYNHKGDKSQKKIFCFLDPKVVSQRAGKPGEEPAYSVKPHVRGFVYATLRDERWYRKNPLKPGEPLRIQEREPTIIHPELFEKEA